MKTKAVPTHYRQGDVMTQVTTTIPKSAVKQDRCILAFGEKTGHLHQIDVSQAFMWVDTDGTKYVEVYGESATLFHQEHGSVHLPGPANYRVIHQSEYTPAGPRSVED